MCLALPMRVIKIKDKEGTVELGGVKRKVNLQLLAEANIGDYLLVHAGFAIQKLDEEEAERTLSFLKEITKKL
ncbi:MAG: HypC/HybG/HupF family hydrogenase formation chaperone [Candidatus Omnitrophica bacterium]|nr:HypC/HybG/HupF family hydrogenase formation chaperone [Candidatus Omnitrophota bacterium]